MKIIPLDKLKRKSISPFHPAQKLKKAIFSPINTFIKQDIVKVFDFKPLVYIARYNALVVSQNTFGVCISIQD